MVNVKTPYQILIIGGETVRYYGRHQTVKNEKGFTDFHHRFYDVEMIKDVASPFRPIVNAQRPNSSLHVLGVKGRQDMTFS